jgi:hypothetical protein
MATPAAGPVRTIPHEVHRLAIAVDVGFEDFRDRYEQAVPLLDQDRFQSLIRADADWEQVQRASAYRHDLALFWRLDVGAIMRLADDPPRCVQYLMGNAVIAERMYRHDPSVMLYAPLRVLIHEDGNGRTWFTVDQPSRQFASFGVPAIRAVGIELDRKLARLLAFLNAPVPSALTAGTASGGS